MSPISPSSTRPSLRLSLICAVVLMSSIARCTCWSRCPSRFTPPIRSAWFSLLASQRAAALDAPLWLSANTLAPRAAGEVKASAWMETNRSACTRRAFCTRVARGTKKSLSRVRKARIGLPPTLDVLMRSRSRCAICSTTSFSCVPRGPLAPGSSPPWPGSSATMMTRSVCATRRLDAAACVPGAGVVDGVGAGAAAGDAPGRASARAISSPSGSALSAPTAPAGGSSSAWPAGGVLDAAEGVSPRRSAINWASGSGGCAG